MAAHRCWPAALVLYACLVLLHFSCIAIEASPSVSAASVSSVGDGSVLQALLESQYSEWMEVVERAQMLHPLEQLVGSGRQLTIFAPQNHQLNAQVKSFLLKPSNAHLLKKTVQLHVLPRRVSSFGLHDSSLVTLAGDSVLLSTRLSNEDHSSGVNVKVFVGEAEVLALDSLVRSDGVVHGIDQMLLPTSVQREFVAFSTRNIATPLPTGAPVLDARRSALEGKKQQKAVVKVPAALVKKKIVAAPSIGAVTARAPALAPAPGPGPSASPYFGEYSGFGQSQHESFIQALKRFGGYSEFAGLLVDMTSIGAEIAKWVNQGRRLTVIAPDDTAWKDALTTDQLTSLTEIEDILRYHIITEYQTEESLYTTVRRNGQTSFNTLRGDSHPLSVREVDGQVVFGDGKFMAGVYDHDIHTDGSISVQGVDKVLMPTLKSSPSPESKSRTRSVLEMLQLPSRATVGRRFEGGTPMVVAATPAIIGVVLLMAKYLRKSS